MSANINELLYSYSAIHTAISNCLKLEKCPERRKELSQIFDATSSMKINIQLEKYYPDKKERDDIIIAELHKYKQENKKI